MFIAVLWTMITFIYCVFINSSIQLAVKNPACPSVNRQKILTRCSFFSPPCHTYTITSSAIKSIFTNSNTLFIIMSDFHSSVIFCHKIIVKMTEKVETENKNLQVTYFTVTMTQYMSNAWCRKCSL